MIVWMNLASLKVLDHLPSSHTCMFGMISQVLHIAVPVCNALLVQSDPKKGKKSAANYSKQHAVPRKALNIALKIANRKSKLHKAMTFQSK